MRPKSPRWLNSCGHFFVTKKHTTLQKNGKCCIPVPRRLTSSTELSTTFKSFKLELWDRGLAHVISAERAAVPQNSLTCRRFHSDIFRQRTKYKIWSGCAPLVSVGTSWFNWSPKIVFGLILKPKVVYFSMLRFLFRPFRLCKTLYY